MLKRYKPILLCALTLVAIGCKLGPASAIEAVAAEIRPSDSGVADELKTRGNPAAEGIVISQAVSSASEGTSQPKCYFSRIVRGSTRTDFTKQQADERDRRRTTLHAAAMARPCESVYTTASLVTENTSRLSSSSAPKR